MTVTKSIVASFVAFMLVSGVSAAGQVTPTPTAKPSTSPSASPAVKKTTVLEKREVCTTTYGGGTECKTVEVPREEIVHTPVETGLVENVILAIGLLVAGYLVMLLAKRYEIIK